MSTDLDTLASRLRSLIDEWGTETARAAFDKQVAGLSPNQRARLETRVFGDLTAGDKVGGDKVGGDKLTAGDITGSTAAIGAGASATRTEGNVEVSGRMYGAAIGVMHQGTVQLFFGGDPGEDGKHLLTSYLDCLISDCQQLRLHRLTGKRQSGSEQQSAPQLHLQDVYTSLTTDGVQKIRLRTKATAARVRRFLERLANTGRTPDDVAPERVLTPSLVYSGEEIRTPDERMLRNTVAHMGLDTVPDETEVSLALTRPELALEAIRTERRLVLLGEPGAGKSTVLRYLAWLLARRLSGYPDSLPGWPQDDAPVPVVVPLGKVAAALREGETPYAALLRVIGDVLDDSLRTGLRRFLTPALREGGVLLLCDGLDELPAAAT